MQLYLFDIVEPGLLPNQKKSTSSTSEPAFALGIKQPIRAESQFPGDQKKDFKGIME